MKKSLIVAIIAVVALIIISSTCLFIVEEGFQAIVLRFGRIVKTYPDAGLKLKLPWDVVEFYSKKILSWDGRSDRIPTEQSEAQFIYVNTTARWKIIDPIKFYSKLGNRQSALNKLDVIIDSAVRTVISNNLLLEAVRSSTTPLDFTVADFDNIPALVRSFVLGGAEEVFSEVTADLASRGAANGFDDTGDSTIIFNAVAQYIYNSLDEKMKRQLVQLKDANTLTRSQASGIVAIFNSMLRDPSLYDAKRFENISIIAHAKALLAKSERTTNETLILNRLLLEAAFPQNIIVSPVKKGRLELSREMLTQARKEMYVSSLGEEIENIEGEEIINQFGIELIDVVIRQIKYSDELKESVYNRMIKERNQIAAKTRYEGVGEKENILGKLKNEVEQIRSKAQQEAEEIKGKADAEATRIYADAYQQNQEFFKFWRTLESYKSMLPGFNKTLTTDADYFDYMYNPTGN
jgi:regulator of protease activity HflC (stomatin/prohibitin superfamily)